jgi:hypothetical protein
MLTGGTALAVVPLIGRHVAARGTAGFGSSSRPTYGYQIRGTPGFKIVGFAAQPLPS